MHVVSRVGSTLLVAGLLLSGCADNALRLRHVSAPRLPPPVRSDDGENDGTHRGLENGTLRVATFNAGLAVGVLPHAVERVEQVASALAALDTDVLCVQELWLDAHFRAVAGANKDRFAHVVRPDPQPVSDRRACSPQEVAPIDACIRSRCSSVRPGTEQAAACAVEHCAHLAWQMSRECLNCLTRDPLRGLEEIEAACVDSAAPARRSGKSTAAEVPALGTSYGLGLFTSQRLLDQDFLRLEPEHHPRGVLYAHLATAALGEAHVFCTHLTPVLSHVPPPRGRSWHDIQSRQVDQLLAFVERKAPAGALVIVLGDLNMGPDVGRFVSSRSPAHFARFETRGFRDPYLEQDSPLCTYCDENPVAGGHGHDGSIIDHVLVRGGSLRIQAHRIFDDSVTIEADGKTVTTALSDHYGIFAELEPDE